MHSHATATSAPRLIFRYRERLLNAVRQDIRQRYAGSVLGVLWALLYPLMLLSIYSVLYLFIFKVRPASLEPHAYVVLVFSGLVPLLAFNESLQAATNSLSANRTLLLNTVFPVELLVVRAVLAAQFPSLAALCITLVAGYGLGLTSWQAPVFIPLMWVLLLMFVCGLGWILSLLVLVARDIQQALNLILMLLTILSPFAYTPDMVPPALKPLLYCNPLSYFVICFQHVVLYGQTPPLDMLAVATGVALGSFYFGYWLFRRTKFVFFDHA